MTTDTTPIDNSETSLDLDLVLRQLGVLWGLPSLADQVTVRFSRRLTSSLGHCRPAHGVLTIADRLRNGPSGLLLEVLVHEAAHAATFMLHGVVRRPHGTEWKALMTAAGYVPRRALDVPEQLRPPRRRRRYVWEHWCPSCSLSRRAGRPVYEWRCAPCRRAGGSGLLQIFRLAIERE